MSWDLSAGAARAAVGQWGGRRAPPSLEAVGKPRLCAQRCRWELTDTSPMHGAVPPCIHRAVHAVRAATDGSGFQVMWGWDLLAGCRALWPDYVRGSSSPLTPHLLRSSSALAISPRVRGLRCWGSSSHLSLILGYPRRFQCPGIRGAGGEAVA